MLCGAACRLVRTPVFWSHTQTIGPLSCAVGEYTPPKHGKYSHHTARSTAEYARAQVPAANRPRHIYFRTHMRFSHRTQKLKFQAREWQSHDTCGYPLVMKYIRRTKMDYDASLLSLREERRHAERAWESKVEQKVWRALTVWANALPCIRRVLIDRLFYTKYVGMGSPRNNIYAFYFITILPLLNALFESGEITIPNTHAILSCGSLW